MNLTKKEQALAVQKILEEMQYAEKYLIEHNFSWMERCFDTRSESLKKLSETDLGIMQKKYKNHYNLLDLCKNKNENLVPLKRVELIDDYYLKRHICEFEGICWYDINSNKSRRNIKFTNDGNISCDRKWSGKLSKKKTKWNII